MSLGDVAASVADAIEEVGSEARLRRLSGRAGIWFDVTVKAVGRGYQPNELTGGIIQGDREFKVSNREIVARRWPGPPRKGDQVITEGRTFTVQAADPVSVGDEIALHIIQARGGS